MLLIIHSWDSGFQNSCRRSKNKRETTFNRTRSGVSPALPLDWNQQLTKSRVRQKMKHKFSDSDWLLNKFHGCWCFSILQPLKLLMKNKLDNLSARLGKGSLGNFETIFVFDSTSGIRTICSDTFFLEHRTRFLPHRSFLRTTSRSVVMIIIDDDDFQSRSAVRKLRKHQAVCFQSTMNLWAVRTRWARFRERIWSLIDLWRACKLSECELNFGRKKWRRRLRKSVNQSKNFGACGNFDWKSRVELNIYSRLRVERSSTDYRVEIRKLEHE